MISISKEIFLSSLNNYLLNSYDHVMVIALCSMVAIFWVLRALGREDEIPGRLGLPFIGDTFSFLSAVNGTKGVYEFVRSRRLRYGKWFKTRVMGNTLVFVPSTKGAKTIFVNEQEQFGREFVKSMQHLFGGSSLSVINKEGHRRIIKHLSEPLSMDSMSSFVESFDKLLCARLKKLEESGQSFRLWDFAMKLNFDAILNKLMSVTDASMLQSIDDCVIAINKALLSFPIMIPGTTYYKGMKARDRLMEIFKGIVRKRRSEGCPKKYKDILQSLMETDSYPAEEQLSEYEILDNLLAVIIGGQSNNATAMMWIAKYLDDNKHVQQRLREEQFSITRNKPDGASLTMEDINKMSYGFKVVKETLRMSNVIVWSTRVALTATKVEGFVIKKGWHVYVDSSYMHLDPDLHKDPNLFNPSRFDEAQKPYSFIPYGSGPRTCVGKNMAKLMMLVFLHRMSTGYTWTVDDPDLSLEKKTIFPILKSGCPITLKALEQQVI